MILIWIVGILMFTGFISWIAGQFSDNLSRWTALAGLSLSGILTILAGRYSEINGPWIREFDLEWISFFNIRFHLAMDGLSFLMLLLTHFLGILAILVSWKEIRSRTGFFYFNIMFILAGISGVFLAEDLFLFYFFWEVMLIPMYFLISVWGHENRVYASYKFFIFTQGGGLLMLLSILMLYFHHGRVTGNFTFDLMELVSNSGHIPMAGWVMSGFLLAFAVKIPAIPFHTWLPDAHTEAPTAGSIILAGLMLKTGVYGFIRIVLPLFPELSVNIAPVAMAIGVAGILYGAKMAFAQTDLKRLVAYTSVSHMGFIIVGLYSFNAIAFRGVVMQMIAHALSTGGLFIVAGIIQERFHTRQFRELGGLWKDMPILGSFSMVFVMASLGLPALANFVAEFMILLGSYLFNPALTILASMGLIFSAIYSLRIIQKVFYGERHSPLKVKDVNIREGIILLAVLLPLVYFGIFPGPVFKALGPPPKPDIPLQEELTIGDPSVNNMIPLIGFRAGTEVGQKQFQ